MHCLCTAYAVCTSLQVCSAVDAFCRLLIEENESMLFAKLPSLTRLGICGSTSYLRGRDAMTFSCLTQLKELCIEKPPATIFLHLAGISTLTRLECGRWEDEIVVLKQLRRLEMSKCQEDAFEGTAVSNLSKLGSLHLGIIDDPYMGAPRLNFSKLQKLLALTELHVTYPERYFWVLTLAQIRELDRLKILYIGNPQGGRLTGQMMLGVTLMKHLVSFHVEVNTTDMWRGSDYSNALLELQAMPCLESMTWTSSEGSFPNALHRLAQPMRKENQLKGYVIEDCSGVYVA